MAFNLTVPFENITDPLVTGFLSRCPFRWQGDVGAQNWLAGLQAPAPTLSSLSPNTIAHGSPDTVITLTGSGFVNGAAALRGATGLATTFVSATSLTATIPAASLAAAGTLQISVRNPDGQSSAQVAFTVT